MAQTGFTPILIYASGTASNVPLAINLTSSASGSELALNYADGKLYYKDSGGVVQLLASKAGASGDVVGPASATDNAVARFDLTTGKLIQNSVVTIGDTGDVAGVVALTASGAITLSGGTANGVAYLNGSKVLTTGSALTFDGTTLTSTTSAATAGNFKATNTTAQVFNVTASNDVNTTIGLGVFGSAASSFGMIAADQPLLGTAASELNIYSSNASGVIKFGLGSTPSEQMRLTSTGLGIGTSSPSVKLDVQNGNATINRATNATILVLGGAPTANWEGDIQFVTSNTNTNWRLASNRNTSGAFTITPSTAAGGSTFTTPAVTLDSSGNLGIGTSSPDAKLDVLGSSSDQIRVRTAETEFYRFGRNSSTGFLDFYGSQTGYQGYTFGGVDGTWATINSSGNLGLGVTPSAWAASSAIQMGNRHAWSQYGYALNSYYDGSNWRYRDSATAGLYQISGNTHQWFTAPSGTAGNAISFTQAMTLDASGNLGIGTSSPGAKLDVNGGTNSEMRLTTSGSGYLQVGQFTNGAFIGTSSTDATAGILRLGTGGTTRATIDSSGNLGLGVTPSAWQSGRTAFQFGAVAFLRGDSSASEIGANAFFNGTNWIYTTTAAASRLTQAAGAFSWHTAPSGTAGNAITFTQAMTLDASGNLLVGTTSQLGASNARVNVSYDGSTLPWGSVFKSDANNGIDLVFISAGNGPVGSISHTSTATTYNTSSDYRLKHDIAPMTGALAKVAALKPCTYKWKVDGSAGEGFIAHELAEVVPQAVTGSKDAVNEDGSIKPQGIDTSFLVATLTAAIQELKAEFDAYKATHP